MMVKNTSSLHSGMRINMYERILTDFDIRTIMDSGQVFRIRPLPLESAPISCAETGGSPPSTAETFLAAAGNHAVLIRQKPE